MCAWKIVARASPPRRRGGRLWFAWQRHAAVYIPRGRSSACAIASALTRCGLQGSGRRFLFGAWHDLVGRVGASSLGRSPYGPIASVHRFPAPWMRRIYAPIQFGSLWWTGRWGCRDTPRADAAGLPARRFAGSDWAPPVNAGESGARAPCSRSSAKVSTTSTMTLGCWGVQLVCLMALRRTYPQLRRGYLTAAGGPRPTMPVHRYRSPIEDPSRWPEDP